MSKWNVMIYLAGDNNLSDEMVWALTEMSRTRADDIAVSAQFDPSGDQIPVHRYHFGPHMLPASQSLWERVLRIPRSVNAGDPKRFHNALKKHQFGKRLILQDLLKRIGIANPNQLNLYKIMNRELRKKAADFKLDIEDTGNPLTLLYFIWWALQQIQTTGKADGQWKHMLVLSGHAAGAGNDFLSDDTTESSLTIQELAAVLKIATHFIHKRKIDILGMDTCLMGTAEVYTQVKDSVDYLVAAEGFEPNSGWPYGSILNGVIRESKKDPKKHREGESLRVAKRIVAEYTRFYLPYALGGQSVDLSACDLNGSDRLNNAISGFAKALIAGMQDRQIADLIILAHWRAQTYRSDQYADLQDIAGCLKEEVGRSAKGSRVKAGLKMRICEACEKLEEAVNEVVKASAYVGPAYQFSSGLSVYFPWSYASWNCVSPGYGQLKFARETHWDKFLAKYLKKTRRDPKKGWHVKDTNLHRNFMGGNPVLRYDGRWDPPHNRWDPPHNRWDPPHNRGKSAFVSMKNPPLAWSVCDLIKGGNPFSKVKLEPD